MHVDIHTGAGIYAHMYALIGACACMHAHTDTNTHTTYTHTRYVIQKGFY